MTPHASAVTPQACPASHPIPVVAAVIRRDDGLILLAQRLPGGPHGGLWEFPGGKVEPGESPEGALAREIWEELGVAVTVGEHLLTVEHAYPHLAVRLMAYACRLSGAGEPRPLQCQALCWVRAAQLADRPMPAADEPIARALVPPERGCDGPGVGARSS